MKSLTSQLIVKCHDVKAKLQLIIDNCQNVIDGKQSVTVAEVIVTEEIMIV